MVCPECGKNHRKYPTKCAKDATFAYGMDVIRQYGFGIPMPENKRYDAWQVYAKTQWGR